MTPAAKGRGAPGRRSTASSHVKKQRPAQRRQKPTPRPTPAAAVPHEPRTFRLAVVPGSTPGKWIDVWRGRYPLVLLELVHVSAADARAALVRGEADAAILRLPVDRADLHVIPLYEERSVVVMDRESSLAAADELTPADLAGEVLIIPGDDVLGLTVFPETRTPAFATIPTTEDVIATVASGVGITVVPMSLARLHHRKDVTSRPLMDAPTSRVALAWHMDRQTDDVDAFIGVVRGRTANSSRS